ncbi:unnamed protein product [Lymnaea stagnalis]|uniref:AIG1-type G domain-containing protein n=1 Tax=Lymnaea stagnalis TaxID=6523 RepID=A0AAV2HQ92_LYMST
MSAPITLMMIGLTGVGKSATVNQILGEKKCIEGDSGESVTSACQVERVKYKDRDVTLVDTPGVMDTAVDGDEALTKTYEEMREALDKCQETGWKALCLVIKFGERFTEEIKKGLYILKLVFGEDFLEMNCVVIVTHGDLFDKKYKGKKSFLDWCREEGGDLGELFRSCSYRCVLFRNETTSAHEKEIQMNELITQVNLLKESYTNSKFNENMKGHNRLKLEAELETLLECVNKKILELEREVDDEFAKEGNEECLTMLKGQASEIEDELNDRDENVFYKSGEESLLKDPKSRIRSILTVLDKRIRVTKLVEEIKGNIQTLRKSISEKGKAKCDVNVVFDLKLEFQNFLDKYCKKHSLNLLDIDSSRRRDESMGSDKKIFLNKQDLVLFKDIELQSHILKNQLARLKHNVVTDRIHVLDRQVKEILPTETNKKIPDKIKSDAIELLKALDEDDEDIKNKEEALDRIIKKAEHVNNKCSQSKTGEHLETAIGVTGGVLAVGSLTASVVKTLATCSKAAGVAKTTGCSISNAAKMSKPCRALFSTGSAASLVVTFKKFLTPK